MSWPGLSQFYGLVQQSFCLPPSRKETELTGHILAVTVRPPQAGHHTGHVCGTGPSPPWKELSDLGAITIKPLDSNGSNREKRGVWRSRRPKAGQRGRFWAGARKREGNPSRGQRQRGRRETPPHRRAGKLSERLEPSATTPHVRDTKPGCDSRSDRLGPHSSAQVGRGQPGASASHAVGDRCCCTEPREEGTSPGCAVGTGGG